jgi:hypothetical protein|tara:strand:- start:29142 stop:29348 length:207 start_codon:yes stop_codon:yes gene_type:complete
MPTELAKLKGNHIPPGSYTEETLPPLSDATKRLLELVQKDAARAKKIAGNTPRQTQSATTCMLIDRNK